MQHATFEGKFASGIYRVGVLGRAPFTWLDERRDLAVWSKLGFAWGIHDERADQLALALLGAVLGPFYALCFAQQFAKEVVYELPVEGWVLTEPEILTWFEAHLPTHAAQVQLGRRPAEVKP
jgi:uncharacterized protein DUF6166